MFAARWRLFRLLGIPVYLDASWLIIFALLTMTLAGVFRHLLGAYYPKVAPELDPLTYWVMAVLAAVMFFACILLHEFGHAVVARSQQMPIRGITLFLFGGVAEIGGEPPSAKAELLMAIAGPLVSVVLALLCGLLAWVGAVADWVPPVVVVLGYLATINTVVLLFNMVPAFPLDGGRVLRSLLWGVTGNLRRATWWASLAGQGFAWLLIVWGLLRFFGNDPVGGIWVGVVGLFLRSAAQESYQQVLIRQVLQGETVRRFMTSAPVVVSPDLDLRSWVEDYVYRHQHRAFPVVSDGQVTGTIDTEALGELPRGEWDRHTVGEVMRRDVDAISIPIDTDALEALSQMQRTGSGRLLVMEGDRLAGILSGARDLLRFLNLRLELEGTDAVGRSAQATPVGPRA